MGSSENTGPTLGRTVLLWSIAGAVAFGFIAGYVGYSERGLVPGLKGLLVGGGIGLVLGPVLGVVGYFLSKT